MTHLDTFLKFLMENNIQHSISGHDDLYFVDFSLKNQGFTADFNKGIFSGSRLRIENSDDFNRLDFEYSFDMFVSVIRNLVLSNEALQMAYKKLDP